MKKTNLLNQRFGKLVALEYIAGGGGEKATWRYICDCGNERKITTAALKGGQRTSCGCNHNKLDEIEQAVNILLCRYKIKAEERSIEFTLEREQFKELILSPCSMCGQLPSVPLIYKGNVLMLYTGIDRIDSFRGYLKDNVAPCCWTCNRAKGTLSLDQFKSWLSQAYRYSVGGVTEKTLGILVDELGTVLIKCFMAQEEIRNPNLSVEEQNKFAHKAQEFNAKRNELIRSIDMLLGFDKNSPTEKTYNKDEQ